MTWGERNERPTWMARHSLVYSSTTVRRRTGLPSLVRRATKSYAQTWFRRCSLSRTQEPSVSQSRPRLGCLAGTLSPSRRQIRSTRLWFTLHPSHCSMAATRRYPYRPYRLASRTTAIVRASSSSATVAVYLCVDRGCSSARQARRSEMPYRVPCHHFHASPPAGRAQKFPRAASFRIWLSNVRSATRTPESSVLRFHLPQPPRLVYSQPPILLPPPVKRMV